MRDFARELNTSILPSWPGKVVCPVQISLRNLRKLGCLGQA
jgi:hypothetical protein